MSTKPPCTLPVADRARAHTEELGCLGSREVVAEVHGNEVSCGGDKACQTLQNPGTPIHGTRPEKYGHMPWRQLPPTRCRREGQDRLAPLLSGGPRSSWTPPLMIGWSDSCALRWTSRACLEDVRGVAICLLAPTQRVLRHPPSPGNWTGLSNKKGPALMPALSCINRAVRSVTP